MKDLAKCALMENTLTAPGQRRAQHVLETHTWTKVLQEPHLTQNVNATPDTGTVVLRVPPANPANSTETQIQANATTVMFHTDGIVCLEMMYD